MKNQNKINQIYILIDWLLLNVHHAVYLLYSGQEPIQQYIKNILKCRKEGEVYQPGQRLLSVTGKEWRVG